MWPWWLGGLALAGVGVFFFWSTGRLLGVSGMVSAVINVRDTLELERADALASDEQRFQAALMEATLKEFGPDAAKHAGSATAAMPAPAAAAALPWKAQLAFLVMLAVGGLLGAVVRGDLAVRVTLGDTFEKLWGTGWQSWAAMFGGGLLVGFGTRMAGGCTSGHGLSGCSRLQPGSLVATATFLGVAVGASLLLSAVLG
jgi:uncharacterized protein